MYFAGKKTPSLNPENMNIPDLGTCLLTGSYQKGADKFSLLWKLLPSPDKFCKISKPTKTSPLFPSMSPSTVACFSFSQFLMCRVCNRTAADCTALCAWVCLCVFSLPFVVWRPVSIILPDLGTDRQETGRHRKQKEKQARDGDRNRDYLSLTRQRKVVKYKNEKRRERQREFDQ